MTAEKKTNFQIGKADLNITVFYNLSHLILFIDEFCGAAQSRLSLK